MKTRAFKTGVFLVTALFAAASFCVISCDNDSQTVKDLPTDEHLDGVPQAAEYNIATLAATYPVLYFGFSLLNGDINADFPTFYHLGRVNTLNHEAMSEQLGVNLVPGVKHGSDDYNGDERIAENFAGKLYERDNSVHLNIYCEDVRAQYALRFVYQQGIPEENCTVYLLSDGAYSANASKILYGGLEAEEALAKLDEDRERVRVMIADAKMGFDPAAIGNMMLAFVLEVPNAIWWFNGASNLPADFPAFSELIQPLLDEGRIVNKPTSALFTSAQNAGKIDVAKAIFNMDEIAGTGEDNGKKTLVVMGTRTNYEMDSTSSVSQNIGGAVLPELFDQVLADYGEDYNIFYKGHPSTPTSDTSIDGGEEKKAYFESRGIKEIADASLPAELLMYLIDGLYIGGYPGSTFQSSKDGQTLFFFCEPDKFKAWLAVPEPDYFLGGNTYFLYKADGTIQKTPAKAADF